MKVFFIGLNKSGSTTFHNFFLKRNVKCLHDITWVQWVNSKQKNKLDQYDVYSDILFPYLDIDWLYKTYPDDLFVLNWRNLKGWLVSRWNHVERNKILGDPWNVNSKQEIKYWITSRNEYHKMIMDYFKDKKNFLTINIDNEKEMLSFLNKFDRVKKMPKFNVHKNDDGYIKEPRDVLECIEELQIKDMNKILSNYLKI